MGHGRDITPLLTSLASSKGLDIRATESVVVVWMVIADLTDSSWFAAVMGNFAVDFIMAPQTAQEALPYKVAVEGVMCRLLAPLTLSKSWLGLLVPRVFDGADTGPKDMLGEVSICGQLYDGTRVEVTVGVGGC